jgi:hypothetical protein
VYSVGWTRWWVRIATGKNVATAVAERPLKRGRPQSICPDVHPLDIYLSSASWYTACLQKK